MTETHQVQLVNEEPWPRGIVPTMVLLVAVFVYVVWRILAWLVGVPVATTLILLALVVLAVTSA